jgi:preprotein translocase subunit SecE
MVWQAETMVDDRTSTPFVRFFVGTEDEYRRIVDPDGKDLPACE